MAMVVEHVSACKARLNLPLFLLLSTTLGSVLRHLEGAAENEVEETSGGTGFLPESTGPHGDRML